MKVDNKKPYLCKSGWLYSGENTLWGNSPAINTNLLKAFCFYQETDGQGGRIKKWYITFGKDLKWNYDDETKLMEDYHIIAELLSGEKDDEKTFI